MTGFPRVAIQDLVLDERLKRSAPADAEVWSLNLDQIESDSGRVLSRLMVAPKALGPSTYPFEAGTVLYSKLRPYLNKVVVADADGYATTELVPLKCDTGLVLPSYLAYFLRSPEFLNFANTVVAGAKMPRMVMGEFWQYKVPLPPLSEQRRIAAILDKADALHTRRREALARLDRLAQSIFVEMFGDPAKNPKGWPVSTLGKYLLDVTNGLTRRGNEVEAGQHIVLRLRDIRAGAIDFSEPNRITLDAKERAKYLVALGELLFIRVNGNPEYVGRCALFDGYSEQVFFNDHVMRVRLKDGLAGGYLAFFLNRPEGKREIAKHRKTSAGQHTINQEGLASISLPIPDLPLQQQFLDRISAIRHSYEAHATALRELDALFAAIQHRAFRGEL